MKVAIVSRAIVAAAGRMDAAHWVPVMTECNRQGIDPNDVERVLGVSRTHMALYGKTTPKLGDLVERAQEFSE